MSVRHEWKANARFKSAASNLVEAMERSLARHSFVCPSDIVEQARPEGSPLHDDLEWREDVAAQRYREDQVRDMIGSLVEVVIEPDHEERRAIPYISVTMSAAEARDDGRRRGYVPAARVASDEALSEQARIEALALLNAWRWRYEHIADLKDFHADLDRALKKEEKRQAARLKLATANA